MVIKDNTLVRIDQEDVIDGVFIAPDKVLYISNHFICNIDVVKMILPNVVEIGSYFLYRNNTLKYLEMPKVEKIGIDFLFYNNIIESIEMPNIKEIGYNCLVYNCKFQYTNEIIKALKGNIFIGGKEVNKKKYLRKIKIQKILC